jgi:hypothetical protein
MRTTELLLICDGEIPTEHRDDYTRAIDYDLERLIHHSRLMASLKESVRTGGKKARAIKKSR